MKHAAAKGEFLKRIEAAGKTLKSLTPVKGIGLMFAFYRDERADGCPIDDDGDMLLFQWGTTDWGDGDVFELDVTRQLTRASETEDDDGGDMRQLSLTFT